MHNIQKKIIFVLILFLIQGCSSISDVGKTMRNEKITTTDEFLIEKRNPLVIPPDSQKVPEPDSVSKKSNNEQEEIQSGRANGYSRSEYRDHSN